MKLSRSTIMKKTFVKRLTGFVLAGVCLAASTGHASDWLPFYNSEDFSPRWIEPMDPELDDFHSIPRFSFTNQDGDKITDRNFQNKVFVANFFFTTCPGICPKVQSKLAMVQDAYLDDVQVEIVSHTITPSIDTVETLKEYAEKHDVKSGKWHLVTGNQEEIYDLAKTAYFASEDLGSIQNTEDFLHTENLLLIDEHKRIRGIYNGLNTTSVRHLINDIAVLKEEMNNPLICH